MSKDPLTGYILPVNDYVIQKQKYAKSLFSSRRKSKASKQTAKRLNFLAKKFLLRNQYAIYNLYYIHGGTKIQVAKILKIKWYDVMNEIVRIKKILKLYYKFFFISKLKHRFKGLKQGDLDLIRDILNLQMRIKMGITSNEYARKIRRKEGRRGKQKL